MGCSPPGSSVRGILQARILEWVAIPFSRGSSRPRDQTQVSHIAGRCFTVWATREAHIYTHTFFSRFFSIIAYYKILNIISCDIWLSMLYITHSSVLAWRIPGTGEPGGLLSMGSYRVGHDWSDLAVAAGIKLFSFPMKPWKNSCLFAFIDTVQNANVNSILLLCVCDLFFLSEVPIIFFSCDTLKFHYSAPGVVQLLSHVWLLATPWTVALQAPPPMGFSRQEDGRELPFPTPGHLPDAGTKPESLLSAYTSRRVSTTAPPSVS